MPAVQEKQAPGLVGLSASASLAPAGNQAASDPGPGSQDQGSLAFVLHYLESARSVRPASSGPVQGDLGQLKHWVTIDYAAAVSNAWWLVITIGRWNPPPAASSQEASQESPQNIEKSR